MEDPIEEAIGSSGRYQFLILILVLIGMFPGETLITNSALLLPTVDFVCLDGNFNLTNKCPCKNPMFDRSVFKNSLVMEWNLICESKWYASLTQSTFQGGLLVGSIIFGTFSDRFGRKLSIYTSFCITTTSIALAGATPEFWSFTFFRFLSGVGAIGTIIISYTIFVELFGKSLRPYLGYSGSFILIISYVVQPWVLYYLRDSKLLLLATGCCWIFVFGYYWLLPESPRWLLAVGRTKEAKELLSRIALWNGRTVDNIDAIVDNHEKSANSDSNHKSSYHDLIRTKNIRRRTFLITPIWMAISFTYYGISQYVGHLNGNIFWNVTLVGAAHLPGLITAMLISAHLKRRLSLIIMFILAFLSLLSLIFVHNDVARLVATAVGTLSIFVSFLLSYLYTSELYPTVLRNSGLGVASLFARLGSITSPFIVDLDNEIICLSLFASTIALAGILVVMLPETKGIVLANSISEIEKNSCNNDSKI